MSIKATLFKVAMIQPKTVSQFWVYIPYILRSPFLVESASYPIEQLGETSIWTDGQQIFFPAKHNVPGEWTCTISEDLLATVKMEVDLVKLLQRSGGTFKSRVLIALTAADSMLPLPHTFIALEGAWLKTVVPSNLEGSAPGTPFKYTLSFRYDYITPISKKIWQF